MSSEDINDADLDAFLKGEDDLSRRLKALDQPAPSAELDAAILARAARPAAANDPAEGGAPMRRMGLRWRLPAGIAATVLAGVLAHQVWQASADMDRSGQARQAAPVPPSPPSPHLPEAIDPAPAPPPKPRAAAPKSRQPAARHIAPQLAEPAPPPPPVSLQTSPTAASFRYAAPAPAPSAAMPMGEERRTVEVKGRRSRSAVVGLSADQSEPAARPDPQIWLAAIDEMIKAGLQRDAVEEWDKFRAAWPDYPVPTETGDKINALRK